VYPFYFSCFSDFRKRAFWHCQIVPLEMWCYSIENSLNCPSMSVVGG
jgi:hypothetical protein